MTRTRPLTHDKLDPRRGGVALDANALDRTAGYFGPKTRAYVAAHP